MRALVDFVNEGIKLPDDKLQIIKSFLNNKDNYNFDNEIECSLFNRNIEINSDVVADIAGYIVEAYVWSYMGKLIENKEFYDEWSAANQGNEFKISPLSRRRGDKEVYWDFTIAGVDEKFEIKARSTNLNGVANGGYRFTQNQRADKNLIYILVKYQVKDNKIIIGDIDVTRKL